VRAVIAGAGAAGLVHALALRAAGAQVVGIFDPDRDRAQVLADACGGAGMAASGVGAAGVAGPAVVGSIEELAALPSELAHVCSPPRAHLTQAEAFARAAPSRIILVEKPLGISLEEIDRFAALPPCVPVVQWRAGRSIRAVRRAVARGELGPSPVVSCDLAWARDEAYLRARGDAWGCGAILSVGIHALDAVLWALGHRDPAGAAVVEAQGSTIAREGAWAETAGVGLVRLASGGRISLRLSFDGGADVTRLAFCGGGVTAVIEGGEADPTAGPVRWHAAPHVRDRLALLERDTDGALGSPLLVPYLADILAALRDGLRPGDSDRLPSVASVASAHHAALLLSSSPPTRPVG